MDAVTIILIVGAVIAGLMLLWGIIALVFFMVGAKKISKQQDKLFSDFHERHGDVLNKFDDPFFKNRRR